MVNTKSNLERKSVYMAYRLEFTIKTGQGRSSSPELEVGTKTEGIEECNLLACSYAFIIQHRIAAQGWHHPQEAGPSHINHYSRKYSWTCLLTNLVEAFPQFRFPFPMTLVCVDRKLTSIRSKGGYQCQKNSCVKKHPKPQWGIKLLNI